MGLFTWSALPKDQDNAQLISEAISEAITNHEADPNAHLGAGESLEQHKSNEIIDHPAFSIVPDKRSKKFFKSAPALSTLAGATISGDVGLSQNGLVYLITTTPAYKSYYKLDDFVTQNTPQLLGKEVNFSADVLIVDLTGTGYFSIGLTNTTEKGISFLFTKSGNNIFVEGRLKNYSGTNFTDAVILDDNIQGFILTTVFFLYDGTTNTCTFYVNGQNIGTLSWVGGTEIQTGSPVALVSRTTSSGYIEANFANLEYNIEL